MKVKVYLHNSIKAELSDDFPKVISYFKAHGVDLELDLENTDIPKGEALVKLMTPNQGKYEIVCFLYNRGVFQDNSNGLAFNISPNLQGIYLATSTFDDAVDYSWRSLTHELMHCLFFMSGLHQLDCMDSTEVEVNCLTGLPK